MNKLFRKMLALLAVTVLVGQTMFTSIVNAVEADVENSVGEEGIISETDELVDDVDVETLSTENLENLEKVKTLSVESLDVEPVNLDGVATDDSENVGEVVVDSQTAGDDARVKVEGRKCVTNAQKLRALASQLNESGLIPDGVDLNVDESTLYLYAEDGVINFTIDNVTTLIDYLLGMDIVDENGGFVWKIMGDGGYYANISNVTQLIDIVLRGGLKAGEEIVVYTSDDCFNLKVIEGSLEKVCSKDDVMQSVVDKLNTYFLRVLGKRDVVAYINNGEIVISYENHLGLISYVTALIDYILTDGNVDDDSFQMKLWKIMGENYKLDISTVTALIDLNLSDESYFTIKPLGNGCSFSNVLVRFQKIEPNTNGGNGGYETCSNPEVKGGDLKVLADILNQKLASRGVAGFTLSSKGTTLYLSVKEGVSASFNISTITSLIDYLLNDKANDVEGWGYIWESMKEAGFIPNISNLTELIDFNLAGGDLTPGKSIPVYANGGCFDFKVIADNGNGGGNNNNNGDNGNSYSGGGSSGGGGSSSRDNSINNNDNEEEEFRGEVVEPQVAESCSIEGSTLSDEENQAYLWACENGMVLADNVMKANFASPLTRAELDKMMSIYAKQLLGRSYVVNESVSYPDVDNSLGDLPYYIQEGYKLQIMGIHANGTALDKFLPRTLVTRGEFATVFSRVLFGSVYNIDGANFYEKHLQVLKDAGILTNTDPSLIEARGWVVLMLYRSQKVEQSSGTISNEEVAEITGE